MGQVRVEHMVPEAGGYAEIAEVVVMVVKRVAAPQRCV